MANVFRRTLRQAGLLIVGGLITITGYSAFTGGGTSVPELTSTGGESPRSYVADSEFNILVSQTGSAVAASTQRYAAVCFPNPLTNLSPSQGTGSLTSLSLEMGDNPAGAGGDVYFTKNCNDHTSTGHTMLINNSCTSSGCVSYLIAKYAMTGATFNGADYIKVSLNKNPTSSFTARLRGTYEDIYGE